VFFNNNIVSDALGFGFIDEPNACFLEYDMENERWRRVVAWFNVDHKLLFQCVEVEAPALSMGNSPAPS